jgi:ABC-2 type transport system permease protein
MRPELTVAGKEFRDHISSKRFLIIFGILMLLAIYSMVNGMNNYNQSLEDYKKNTQANQQQPWYQEQIASLEQQIADAQSKGDTDTVEMLQYQLDQLRNPPMPSMLYVFSDMNQYFVLIAMVLAVAIGFDLISREKEEGSLKSLLSHPLYRDAIINGKAIGAMSVLAVSMAAMFIITIAIMLFYGVVPGGDDILRIIAYFVMALIYCAVFFALALMTSTLAKSSAMSVLYVLGIVIAMVIIPMFSYQLANLVLGPAPQMPDDGGVILYGGVAEKIAINSTDPVAMPEPLPADSSYIRWSEEMQKYYEKQNFITSSINAISPINNFQSNIASAILYKYGGSGGGIVRPMYASSVMKPYIVTHDPTVWESLAYVWNNIVAMLVELILPLALSYVIFLRADVR